MSPACQSDGHKVEFAGWARWIAGLIIAIVVSGIGSANVFILKTNSDMAAAKQQIKLLQQQVNRLEERINRTPWSQSMLMPEGGGG